MGKKIKRLVILATIALSAGAVMDQLKRPKEERTWQGRILGMPYDFRIPTPGRLMESWWNPSNPSLFTPKVFGLGWDINWATVVSRLTKKQPPYEN